MTTQPSGPALRRPSLRPVHAGALSVRVNVRVLALCGGTFALLVMLAAWAMTLGSFPLSVADVIAAAIGNGSDQHEFIVRTLRLPRVLVAVLAGASLALAGAVFQGIVRNPLVSPDIIGIDAGATFAAVAWTLTGQDYRLLPVAAFIGAVSAAVAIYMLTWRKGIAANRMILVGIGVSALFSAGTTYLMLRYPIERVSSAVHWTTGSVYAADWQDVSILIVLLAALLPATIILMWPLRVLQFGDDSAAGLGMRVEPTRLLLIGSGCALSATAVSIVGPIGFVALMTPHVARMVAGPMTGSVLLLTALIGSVFLLSADITAQHVLPVAMPVGVVTGVIGAPYFLFLLYRSNARL